MRLAAPTPLTPPAGSGPERGRGRRRWSRAVPSADPAWGAAAALVLCLGGAAAAVALPPLARFVPLGVLAAVVLLALQWSRAHPARTVDLALWLWVLAPGLRRVIDWTVGFDENSLALLAAPVAGLCCGASALWGGAVADRRLVRLLLRVLVVVGYGAVVAVVVGRSPAALGLAAVQVLAPLGLAACVVLRVRRSDLLRLVTRYAAGVALLVGGYGIAQYFIAPAWDAQWLRDVADVATSFGRPYPQQIRVFSTVNDPGSLAIVLVFCLLWLLALPRMTVPAALAIAVGSACLGLTLVRSAWIALAVGLVVLLVRGWVRTERLVVVATVVGVTVLLLGTALQPVVDRFQEARSAGTQDESFQARFAFQSQNLLPALLDPVGAGLGATGTAVRRDDSSDQRFANTDSGYLEVLRTYGGPLGLGLLTATATAAGVVVTRPDRRARGAAAFAATVPVQLAFSSIYSGVIGAVLWLALVSGAPRADPDQPS